MSAGKVGKNETGAPGRGSAHQEVKSQATSLGSWPQPQRDKQMHLLKLQELKRVPHASLQTGEAGCRLLVKQATNQVTPLETKALRNQG